MSKDYEFRGFHTPTYTQVPDEFFDELAPNLTESELRVALYVIRRTFGFKKISDAISFNQLISGITTKDGAVLDLGTGMSRSAVWRGAKGLVAKGVLVVDRSLSPSGDQDVNVYGLRFFDEGVVLQKNHPSSAKELPVVLQENPQETVKQQTELQEEDRSNDSKDINTIMSREDVEQITWIIQDIAREFADQAPLKSSTTRAANLFQHSGLGLDDFLDRLQQARLRTKRYSGSIKSKPVNGSGSVPVKPKMAYLFSVLEDLVESKS